MVNLGCGLDNTGRACDNGRCKIYNLDFPDVIALRQQLLPAGEREQNIPHILDLSRFEPCFCDHLHRCLIGRIKDQNPAGESICHPLHQFPDLLGQNCTQTSIGTKRRYA